MNFNNIINPDELLNWIEQGKDYQLIDLSTDNLLSKLNIKSEWIPEHTLLDRISELEHTKPVVLSCKVGAGSFMIMNILVQEYFMQNVLSLRSGFNGLEQLINNRIPFNDKIS